MSSRWNTARLALRRAGVESLVTVALRGGLRPFGAWQALVFFERDLTVAIPDVAAGIPVETRVVAPRELESYRPALEAAGLRWDRLEARAAQGDVCTVALWEGKLVHVSWVTVAGAWVPELRATLRPAPGDAYVYDAFTLPEVRGTQVQPAASAHLLAWARDQGHRRVTFYVRGSNPSALRIVEKTRARRTGVVWCFRPGHGDGAWMMGLRSRHGPRIDFGAGATVRSLGPAGLWVRHQPR
jgi:GNAT superfamily N-acetyltransferase